MNPSCLKYTFIPGTSRLFLDYLYHFDHVAGYFDWNPFESNSFHRAAGEIAYPAERRRAIVAALARQNADSSALDILADPKSVAVVTGQQVGLFSGPAYTVYKAITAVRLAQRLNQEGLRAVPVFWLATEDHDLAEVDHAWVFDSQRATPIKLQAAMTATGGPVGSVPLQDVPLAQLEESLSGFPYASDVMEMVRRAYKTGSTLGGSFHCLVKEILRDLGMLFLDPLDPAIRDVAAPFLAESARQAPALIQALIERNRSLQDAGYHAQVHVDADSSPVFVLEGGKRLSFKLREGQFVNKQGSFSVEQLQSKPGDISPNALLRPVMQDYLLPTVAYVGGPAEIAYMAQGQVAYHKLLGRMPVMVPRNGFTLLNDRTAKLLTRYRLQPQELLEYEQLTRERMAQRLVPPALEASFSASEKRVEEELSRLSTELTGFDPTLHEAAQKSAKKIRYQLSKLAGKAKHEALRRDERASADADYLVNMIYPHRHLQERFYTILPFLAQHGPGLIGRLLEAAQLDCPDHMVRTVSGLA